MKKMYSGYIGRKEKLHFESDKLDFRKRKLPSCGAIAYDKYTIFRFAKTDEEITCKRCLKRLETEKQQKEVKKIMIQKELQSLDEEIVYQNSHINEYKKEIVELEKSITIKTKYVEEIYQTQEELRNQLTNEPFKCEKCNNDLRFYCEECNLYFHNKYHSNKHEHDTKPVLHVKGCELR